MYSADGLTEQAIREGQTARLALFARRYDSAASAGSEAAFFLRFKLA